MVTENQLLFESFLFFHCQRVSKQRNVEYSFHIFCLMVLHLHHADLYRHSWNKMYVDMRNCLPLTNFPLIYIVTIGTKTTIR